MRKIAYMLSAGALIVFAVALYSYYYLDRPLALFFHQLHNHPLEDFINRLSVLGESQWYLVPALMLWIWYKKRGNIAAAKKAQYLFLANVIAGIGVWLLKIPFGRMRPRLLFLENKYGFEGWGISYPYVSFPSGHSITVFVTATALALLFPRYRILFFLIAVPAAFSRVTKGAHYLSDVLVGSYLGILVAILLYYYMFGKDNVQNKTA